VSSRPQPSSVGSPELVPSQADWTTLCGELYVVGEQAPRGQRPVLPQPNSGLQDLFAEGLMVVRSISDLHPHPSCVQHQLSVTTAQLSALADRGDYAFAEPLVVTQQGTIIDGRARLELARLQGRTTLRCLEYHLTDSQALEKLIQMHRRSDGVNDFSRILLALDLEPELRERARQNQSLGGQSKGSSNLTEAARLDIRDEIAKIAGVSVGNVTKVKQILAAAPTDIIRALREHELSIHRAWSWCKFSAANQKNLLWELRSSRGVRKVIRELISRHKSASQSASVTPMELTALLRAVDSGKLDAIRVVPVRAPGKAIFVTEKLLRSLQPQEGFAFNGK
jgi:ParB-like chromosome segregation protein Spo0J